MADKNNKIIGCDDFFNLYSGNDQLAELLYKRFDLYDELNFISVDRPDEDTTLTTDEKDLVNKCKEQIQNNENKEPHFALRFAYAYSQIFQYIEDVSDENKLQEQIDYCKQLIEKAYQEDGNLVSFIKLLLKTKYPESYDESIDDLLKETEESGLRFPYIVYRYSFNYVNITKDFDYPKLFDSLYEYFKEDKTPFTASLVTEMVRFCSDFDEEEQSEEYDFLDSKEYQEKFEDVFYYNAEESENYSLYEELANILKDHGNYEGFLKNMDLAASKNVHSSRISFAAHLFNRNLLSLIHNKTDEETKNVVIKMYELVSGVSQEDLDKNLHVKTEACTLLEHEFVSTIKAMYFSFKLSELQSDEQHTSNILREYLVNCVNALIIHRGDIWHLNPLLEIHILNFFKCLLDVDLLALGLPANFVEEFFTRFFSNIENIENPIFKLGYNGLIITDSEHFAIKIAKIAYDNCISNPTCRENVLAYDLLWDLSNTAGIQECPSFLAIPEVYKIQVVADMKNKDFLRNLKNKNLELLIYRIYATYFVFENTDTNESQDKDVTTKALQEYVSLLPKNRIKKPQVNLETLKINYLEDLKFLFLAGCALYNNRMIEKNKLKAAILANESYLRLAFDEESFLDIYGKLGDLYATLGNIDKSRFYYQEGIKKGDEFSCMQYADMVFKTNPTKGIALLEKYMKNIRSADMQIKYADLLVHSKVQKNIDKGIQILERLVSKNNANAQYALGIIYKEDEAVKKDIQKSIDYFKSSARLGLFNSAYCLLYLYIDEHIMTKEIAEELITFFEELVKNGSDISKALLAFIYADGLGGNVAIDSEKSNSYINSMKIPEFAHDILNKEYRNDVLIVEEVNTAVLSDNTDDNSFKNDLFKNIDLLNPFNIG